MEKFWLLIIYFYSKSIVFVYIRRVLERNYREFCLILMCFVTINESETIRDEISTSLLLTLLVKEVHQRLVLNVHFVSEPIHLFLQWLSFPFFVKETLFPNILGCKKDMRSNITLLHSQFWAKIITRRIKI